MPFSRVIGNDIVRMESEFYNSNTVSYKNTVKASQIIDFSQYGTSKELNEMGEGYPVLRLNEFNYSFILSYTDIGRHIYQPINVCSK